MPDDYYIPLHARSEKNGSRRLQLVCILSATLNLAFIWLSIMHPYYTPASDKRYIYSPAQHVVRHKLVKFTRGLADDVPVYERPPSAAVDEAWRELYSVAATKMSRSEAMQMPNKTWPLLGEEGSYIFALDVFHQLHCLDTLRQQASISTGSNYPRVPSSHLRHCVGALRQALMCAADITPVVWQWSAAHQIAEQRDDVVHVCRNYEGIRQWASEHTFADNETDLSVYIEDDLHV